jgi:hypothetical protein
MPRQLRLEYGGAIYHVMNRGDRREIIFRDDEDRARFLGTVGQTCEKTGWEVQGWCLMSKQIVHEELTTLGWTQKELQQRRKGDENKVRIARRLRKETTVSLKWIASSLLMGTWTYVANRLGQS